MEQGKIYEDFWCHFEKMNDIFDMFAMAYVYMYDCLRVVSDMDSDVDSIKEIDTILNIYQNDISESSSFIELKRGMKSILLKQKNSYEYCYHVCSSILKWMDDIYIMDDSARWVDEKKVYSYDSLNTLLKERIKILPAAYENSMIGTFAKIPYGKYPRLRKRQDAQVNSIASMIKNFIIIDSKEYDIVVHRINPHLSLVKRVLEEKKISVGIFPVSNEKFEDYFKIQVKKDKFQIAGMEADKLEKLKKRYVEIAGRFKSQCLDVVVFPEMMMVEQILPEIVEKAFGNCLKICGSEWKERHNTSSVYFGREKLFDYEKKAAFKLKINGKEYTENILLTEPPYRFEIIEIENIGRMGVCICKDVMLEEVFRLHKMLQTIFLLVPMYSDSFEVIGSCKKFAKELHCLVITANACSARKENENVGAMLLPGKNLSDSSSQCVSLYYNKSCNNDCADYCMGKILKLDFNKERIEKGILTVHYDFAR